MDGREHTNFVPLFLPWLSAGAGHEFFDPDRWLRLVRLSASSSSCAASSAAYFFLFFAASTLCGGFEFVELRLACVARVTFSSSPTKQADETTVNYTLRPRIAR